MSSNNVMINEIRVAHVRDPRLPHPAEVAVDERAGTDALRGTVGSIRQL